jgi:hypothetical protein
MTPHCARSMWLLRIPATRVARSRSKTYANFTVLFWMQFMVFGLVINVRVLGQVVFAVYTIGSALTVSITTPLSSPF